MKTSLPASRIRTLRRSIFTGLFILLVAGCAQFSPGGWFWLSDKPAHPAILISIDGFRPDYLERGVTPNLKALAASGARASAMRPSFPSMTFPNHYTMVTGLRPDRSGMVGNSMEDASMPGVLFSLGNREALIDRRWWEQAEPVWVTAEKRGVRSATMFWPGSEAAIHGVRPGEWRPYDGKISADGRVAILLGWLDKPVDTRPAFLTLYFDDVDYAGHRYGPNDERIKEALAKVDLALGQLLAGLEARKIKANIVIVSDHGMAETSKDRIIRMEQIAPVSSWRAITGGTYAGFEASAGQEAVLAAAILKPHPHMQCWRKENIPARFQYGKNARVPSFICLAEVGWLIDTDRKYLPTTVGGAHGYDHMAPEMEGLFIASGPAFRPVVLPAFDNVDVYPLLMRLIGLRPLESDGNITSLLPALK